MTSEESRTPPFYVSEDPSASDNVNQTVNTSIEVNDVQPSTRQPKKNSRHKRLRRSRKFKSKSKQNVYTVSHNVKPNVQKVFDLTQGPLIPSRQPVRTLDGVVCLLTSDIYMVSGSIGTEQDVMTSHDIAVDTCAGCNLIKRSSLPPGWEQHVVDDPEVPVLGGAESSQLKISGIINLVVRFKNTLFRLPFVICDNLVVDVILGTTFLNTHVGSIDVENQRINFRNKRGSVPILSSNVGDETTPDGKTLPNKKPKNLPRKQRKDVTPDVHDTHVIRLAQRLVIPPMTQAFVNVTTTASGLVYSEPKPSLQDRYGLRIANGIHETEPQRKFKIFISNFSRKPRMLPRNTVVGYAKSNPIALIVPQEDLSRDIANVHNITEIPSPNTPPNVEPTSSTNVQTSDRTTRYRVNQLKTAREIGTQDAASTVPLQERVSDDWRKHVDLSHVEDEKLRTRILDMLAAHQKMWDGHLGTIQATEHRINVEPGTKPLRSMPYRQGPAMRKIIKEHVDTMLEADVIEPATSEWASPVVLAPKKDGRLRFCVDYRKLNEKTVRDTYPLPRIDDCIDSLGEATVFYTLDCNSGYWQIPIAEEDRDKTTSKTYL